MRYSSHTILQGADGGACLHETERIDPMKAFDCAVIVVFAVMAPVHAHAEDTTARAWAATCLSCHQIAAQRMPKLQGQTREALIARLRAFRNDPRAGSVMPQLVNGYSEAQLEAIAAWFASQPSDSP